MFSFSFPLPLYPEDDTESTLGKPLDILSLSWDSLDKNKLGSGSSCTVYRGSLKGLDGDVAIKIIPEINSETKKPNKLYYEQERGIMARIAELPEPSPYIVKSFGYAADSVNYYLIFEYLQGGTLFNFISTLNKDYGKFSELDETVLNQICQNQLLPAAIQIADGLRYLHKNAILHCDIKPENIMFNENREVKIVDFGFAIDLTNNLTDPKCLFGTPEYLAPELIIAKANGRSIPYSCKSDVFSFGRVLYVMFNWQHPMPAQRNVQSIFMATVQKVRPAFARNCPDNIQTVIGKGWKHNPDKRLDANQMHLELMRLTFFNQPSVEELHTKERAYERTIS